MGKTGGGIGTNQHAIKGVGVDRTRHLHTVGVFERAEYDDDDDDHASTETWTGFTDALQHFGFTGSEGREILGTAQVEKMIWGIVENAAEWRDAGFTMPEMARWNSHPEGHLSDVRRAVRWRDAGFTPEHAQAIRARFGDRGPANSCVDDDISSLAWAAEFPDPAIAAEYADAAEIGVYDNYEHETEDGDGWGEYESGWPHVAAAAGQYHRAGRTPAEFGEAHLSSPGPGMWHGDEWRVNYLAYMSGMLQPGGYQGVFAPPTRCAITGAARCLCCGTH